MTSRRVPPSWREGVDGCRPYDGGTLAEGPPAAWTGPAGKRRPLAPETHEPLYILGQKRATPRPPGWRGSGLKVLFFVWTGALLWAVTVLVGWAGEGSWLPWAEMQGPRRAGQGHVSAPGEPSAPSLLLPRLINMLCVQ